MRILCTLAVLLALGCVSSAQNNTCGNNDSQAPVVRNVVVPVINVTQSRTFSVRFNITDDSSGVRTLQANVQTQTFSSYNYVKGFGSYTAPTRGFCNTTNLALSITVNENTGAGTYVLSVYVCDWSNNCQTYTRTITIVGAATNPPTITCNFNNNTAIDVKNSGFNLSCTFKAALFTGIGYATFIVRKIDGGSFGGKMSPGEYIDNNANSTTLTSVQTYNFPQFSPAGTYLIEFTVYGPTMDQFRAIQTTTTFKIANTSNDQGPPVLKGVSVPLILDVSNIVVRVTAQDDASGIAQIFVQISKLGGVFGNTVWITSEHAPLPKNTTNVYNIPIDTLYADPGQSVGGVYDLLISLRDSFGNDVSYFSQDLARLGFQANVTVASSNCAAGSYRPYGSTAPCTVCPSGTQSEAGALRCKACPPGYTTNGQTGSTACTACPAGYQGIGASWACTACPAGFYQPEAGKYQCVPCEAGTTSTAGATSCTKCAAGSISRRGQAGCSPCAAGTFAMDVDYCAPCDPGTFSDAGGSTSCAPCARGTFSSGGFSACTPCENGKTGIAQSNSKLNCY